MTNVTAFQGKCATLCLYVVATIAQHETRDESQTPVVPTIPQGIWESLFETIDSYNGDFVPFARLLARNLGVTLEESEDSFTVDSFVTGRVTRDKSEAIWTVQDIVNARVCPDSGPPCESYLQELKEAEEAFLQEYGNI